uniref:B30.2/SPRY domain-containing protein n=1 Tax=Globodera pallida TaxID=36090 RepID=A0A183BL42_GLOPA
MLSKMKRQQNALQQKKVVKLEKYQKEEQLNIVHLQKTVATLREMGLTPQQNRWNSTACYPSLALSELGGLTVQHNGDNWGWGSVIAEKRMLETPYFEVTILEQKGFVLIGLATKQMPLDEMVGWYKGTYGYRSDGMFWSYEVDRSGHNAKRRTVIKEKPLFGKGDVVGCGVNLKNRQLIYTKNGRRLDTDGLRVYSAADLFPSVSLDSPGTKIEANFGPNFQFNIAE